MDLHSHLAVIDIIFSKMTVSPLATAGRPAPARGLAAALDGSPGAGADDDDRWIAAAAAELCDDGRGVVSWPEFDAWWKAGRNR